jgi:hypothetical protein
VKDGWTLYEKEVVPYVGVLVNQLLPPYYSIVAERICGDDEPLQ